MDYFNLQLTSPFKTCPYKCKYCVSNFSGDYPFENLYNIRPWEYFKSLRYALATGKYSGIVITGMTDPSLFPKWIEDVLHEMNMYFPKITVTLQTANMYYRPQVRLDVLAYSVGSIEKAELAILAARKEEEYTVRYNLMLSKEFDYEDILTFYDEITKINPLAQFTVKYLYPTSNGHDETDKWISENRLELDDDVKAYFKGLDIWVDEACMDNENRYHVFRENGKLYPNWYEK